MKKDVKNGTERLEIKKKQFLTGIILYQITITEAGCGMSNRSIFDVIPYVETPEEICARCSKIVATWDDKKVGKCTHIETRLVRLEKQCEFKESKFKKKDGE